MKQPGQSEKSKAAVRKYQHSEKGKAVRLEYQRSEKCRAARRGRHGDNQTNETITQGELGERLHIARMEQDNGEGLSFRLLAEQSGGSPVTVRIFESGHSLQNMVRYLHFMSVLGWEFKFVKRPGLPPLSRRSQRSTSLIPAQSVRRGSRLSARVR